MAGMLLLCQGSACILLHKVSYIHAFLFYVSVFSLLTNLLGLMALSYIILCACLAEIGSAIPCRGGNYGLSRVVLGFYLGFMVGALQVRLYLMY